MTAPTLVMVAPGSRDQRVVRIAHALQAELTALRPEVKPEIAFLDSCLPSLSSTLGGLHADGVREAVIVPLDLVHAVEVDPRYSGVVAQATRELPGLHLLDYRFQGGRTLLLPAGIDPVHSLCHLHHRNLLDGLPRYRSPAWLDQ